ncbi:MAG: hypothetical protein H6Q33_5065 [Deltaproteobacteria bacterium]|nr:hypothetical protein [Deltaproteobacteria bacterium]
MAAYSVAVPWWVTIFGDAPHCCFVDGWPLGHGQQGEG